MELDGLRPEYLEAVAASRWNLWLVPLFLISPLLLGWCNFKRTSPAVTCSVFLLAVVGTWISLFLYGEHIWEMMKAHAVTDAEWREYTSDTGRLFGPIFFGVPFSVLYAFVWWVVTLFVGWLARWILRRVSPAIRIRP